MADDDMELVDLGTESSFSTAPAKDLLTVPELGEQLDSMERPMPLRNSTANDVRPESPTETPAAVETPEETLDDRAEAIPITPADGLMVRDTVQQSLSSGETSRSILTQTELTGPATPTFEAADDDGQGSFPVRRAVSDWALTDRSRSTAHIRSERIRRTAQLFEDLAQAQEERQAALTTRRGGRRGFMASASATTPTVAVLPPEREVLLVPLPGPPPQPSQSRQVDAILALGSGGGADKADSDAEGDERDEEALWEKVRAKIAARRDKFRRLESRQDEPEIRRAAPAKQTTHRLPAERTSWLTNGKPAAPSPSTQEIAALKQQKLKATAKQHETRSHEGVMTPQSTQQVAALRQKKVTTLSSQNASESSKEMPRKQKVASQKEQKKMAPPKQSGLNGHTQEATRSYGKYIDQREEQEVLRSLGSAVLAKQRLSTKEKAREQLLNEQAEAERRQKKAENQKTDAQTRLEKTKGRLTRDSAFERKGLETLLTRLDGVIREETRKIDKLSAQISDADAEIEVLRRRAAI